MEAIVYTIIGLALTSVFVELLTSDGETGKYVRAVYGIICVLVVLSVIADVCVVSLKKVKNTEVYEYVSESDLTALQSAQKKVLISFIEYGLSGYNSQVVRIDIEYENKNEEKIKSVKLVLTGDKDESDSICEQVAKMLSIEKDMVGCVYE